jgi:hypothetical protein
MFCFRLFVINLAVTLIITESPAAAFTIRQTKTTTLKPLLDLTGEASALLEVRHDLPKTNNVKGNLEGVPIKYGTKTPRKFANILDIAKKSTVRNNAPTSTVEFVNESVKPNDIVTITNPRRTEDYSNNVNLEKEKKIKGIRNDDSRDKTNENRSYTKVESIEETSTTNSDIQKTTISFKDETTLSEPDTIEPATRVNNQKESLNGEASSSLPWKTYTTIDRKRTTTVNPESLTSTEAIEVLDKSETITTKITWDKSNVTLTPLIDDFGKELITDLKVQTISNDVDTSSVPYTGSIDNNSPVPEPEKITGSTDSARDKAYTLGHISSKRAGFLDLTVKETATEKTSTDYSDGATFNETQLIGAMFEIDDGLESKKIGVESQGQLVSSKALQ